MVLASIPQMLHLNISYEEIPTNVSTTACSSCNYAAAACNFPTTCHSPCMLECFVQWQHFKRGVRTQEHRTSSLIVFFDSVLLKVSLTTLCQQSWCCNCHLLVYWRNPVLGSLKASHISPEILQSIHSKLISAISCMCMVYGRRWESHH